MRRFIALAVLIAAVSLMAACARPAGAPIGSVTPTPPIAPTIARPGLPPTPAPLPPDLARFYERPPLPTPVPTVTATPPHLPLDALLPPAVTAIPLPPTPTPHPIPLPQPAGPPPAIELATVAPPAPTPTPDLPAGYADLPYQAQLEQQDPVAAQIIRGLPWVADGVSPAEQAAAGALVKIAISHRELFDDLTAKSWLRAAAEPEPLGPALAALHTLGQREPAAALRIAAMPFLNTLEPADAAALESLSLLAATDRDAFRQVMAHQSMAGGIGDAAAKVVTVLAGVAWTNPDLLPRLLDFSSVTLEERVIELPQAGAVTLVIIRIGPGAERSMDLLEQAVRFAEDYMGEPFPQPYVTLLFAAAVPPYFDGGNFRTHIAVRPEFDRAEEVSQSRTAGRVITHEVAHYYWDVKVTWLDEGAAEFMAAAFEEARAGAGLMPNHYPCRSVPGIRDLAAQNYPMNAPEYQCNYALGERLFLDLQRTLSAEDFRQGFQQLYRDIHSTAVAAGDSRPWIEQVRAAFQGADTPEGMVTTAVVNQIIGRWYDGDKSYNLRGQDQRAAVAELPAVNGRINRAYLSLTRNGEPTHRFAATAPPGWGWLTVEYSYRFAGPPRELELEVVEFFEDGFAYRRVQDRLTLTEQSSGGTRWYSIGQGAGRPWAVGRHWIYVYHQGVKVAEVEYEVTEG